MQVHTQHRSSDLHHSGFTAGGAVWPGEAIDRRKAANGVAAGGAMLDAHFVELQAAYRPSGGLAHGDELADRLHVDGNGGYARLARWILSRQLFSFTWNEHFWVPMFQFDASDLSPHPCLRPVLAELMDVMDGKALATWFAEPNDALRGFSPVAMWSRQAPDVFHAARLQRFVIKG